MLHEGFFGPVVYVHGVQHIKTDAKPLFKIADYGGSA